MILHLSDKASCGPRIHAPMLFFFLVKRVFLTASLTFQQYSSPTCFYHAASQKPPHFNFNSVSRFFGLFGICQRWAVEPNEMSTCSLPVNLCDGSEDKIGCFSLDELCQKHLLCHLQWLNPERESWKRQGGNLSTLNAASCFLDRCLFWVVWFCTDVHRHKVEK